MIENKKRYMITSALPYANGPLHIGHLAGAYLPADVYVRYLRAREADVVWVCGSDEHGAAITIKAMKEGLTPRQIIDKYDAMFRDAFEGMGIEFDIFHRTSEPIHYATSQDFFRTLYKNNEFEVNESEQYFDEEKQTFLADRYIMGVCPVCANPDAYGDQCEKCGTSLSPNELKSPIRSTLSGSTPVKKPTKHWYLKLNNYENWLKKWIAEGKLDNQQTHNPNDWKPHVLGQCKSWLEGGLQPRAMTRDLEWGIPVPPEIDETGSKKLYVWLDAPIGYISATKQWAIDNKKPDEWKKYWQDDQTALIHFIGKDNIVFHCIIFPALLKQHGGYVLPVNVPANQFLNLEGRKISTSRNWAVWVHEYLAEFKGKEDVLRYYMIKNMPENRDAEFTWRGFQEANNSELVGNLANFINRVVVLINKNFDGAIPPSIEGKTVASSDDATRQVTPSVELDKMHQSLLRMTACIEAFNFREALGILMEISTQGNQILQFNEPWKLAKTDPEAAGVALNLSAQIVANLAIAMQPFLPFSAKKLLKMLNLKDRKDNLNAILSQKILLKSGHRIDAPQHLFERIGDEVVAEQIKKLENTDMENAQNTPPPVSEPKTEFAPLKETIQFDDFAKMDIRTGKILSAERVPKADKLLKLEVDLGFETRTIVSGIAEHFDPTAIVGQSVVVLANLAPRKLRGIESNGMILMAENAEGKLSFVSAPSDFGNGLTVR